MIRVISTILRISWIYRPKNIELAIAAQIFVAAGTVILFIINLFFTQRLMRARHPHIGWNTVFKVFIPPLTVIFTIINLLMVVTTVVQQFFTLSPRTHRIDRDVQLAVLCWFTFVAFLPIPLVVIVLAIPRRTYIDKFGAGRFRTKVGVLLGSSSLLTLGAAFRCGTLFKPQVPLGAPTPWYLHKACFYVFDFSVEVIVVMMYVLVRVDRRFFVPNGAHGPGEYSGDIVQVQPTGHDGDVYTLSSDGRTLSTGDDRTGSLTNKRTNSLAQSTQSVPSRAASLQFPMPPNMDDAFTWFGKGNFDDGHSRTSSALGINPRNGKYELKSLSQASMADAASAQHSDHPLVPHPAFRTRPFEKEEFE